MTNLNSSIEWTDTTWSPTVGCTKISAGCDNCYAEGIARRFAGSKAFPNGFDLTLHPQRLTDPLRWRKPRKVFVNSMSDLFHSDVPDEFIERVFAVMAATPMHTYQLLTKRPGRMRSLLNRTAFREHVLDAVVDSLDLAPDWADNIIDSVIDGAWPLPNVWLGVSVEDQKWATVRIPLLIDTPAAVRFLSCEPLLGPVDLSPWIYGKTWSDTTRGAGGIGGQMVTVDPSRIDWVIAGGESGPGARPMHPAWARKLRDDCQVAGVAFFFKQWGAWQPITSSRDWVAGARMLDETGTWLDLPIQFDRTHLGAVAMQLRSKRAAGRELDGRTWDEYPQQTVMA